LTVTAVAALSVRAENARAGQRLPIEQTITFDDLAPHGMVLEQCWDAIGMDRQGRVYIGFTGKRPDGREDFAVFRYEPSTGNRRLLGTFMDVSQAAGKFACSWLNLARAPRRLAESPRQRAFNLPAIQSNSSTAWPE